MPFEPEPTFYVRGSLSDLQGAWSCLREAALNLPPSEIQKKLIFHIDEGMSWESVRHLKQMKKTILLISNIVQQGDVDDEVQEWLEDVRQVFDDVIKEVVE